MLRQFLLCRVNQIPETPAVSTSGWERLSMYIRTIAVELVYGEEDDRVADAFYRKNKYKVGLDARAKP